MAKNPHIGKGLGQNLYPGPVLWHDGANYKKITGKTDMSEHFDIADLHLNGLHDLEVVKDGHPPFDFNSLYVPAGPAPQYTQRGGNDFTYWGPK